MTSVVEALLDNAYQDSVLLEGNDEKGDVFSIPRDVDFLLYAPDKEKGELVANFINDNCYGDAGYYQSENNHWYQGGNKYAHYSKRFKFSLRFNDLFSKSIWP